MEAVRSLVSIRIIDIEQASVIKDQTITGLIFCLLKCWSNFKFKKENKELLLFKTRFDPERVHQLNSGSVLSESSSKGKLYNVKSSCGKEGTQPNEEFIKLFIY